VERDINPLQDLSVPKITQIYKKHTPGVLPMPTHLSQAQGHRWLLRPLQSRKGLAAPPLRTQLPVNLQLNTAGRESSLLNG